MARVSLKEVALAAGVSVSTASLAVRGKGNLKASTVEKVQALAEKMGYTPDPILSSLGSKRFHAGTALHGTPLAVLRFPISHSGVTLPRADYLKGVLAHSKRMGYLPQAYDHGEIPAIGPFLHTLYHRGVAGIIIIGQAPASFFQQVDLWKRFAIVQCGRYEHSLPIHTVRADVFRAVKLAWDKLALSGCRRIGFALGRHPDLIEDDESRLGAAWVIEHFHAAPRNRVPPFMGDFKDTDSALAWFLKERPDGVIGFHPGQYSEFIRHGIRIPGEANFVVMHANPSSGDQHAISGLTGPDDEICRQSVSLLDTLVRHNERGIPESARHVLIPPRWIDGQTVVPRDVPKETSARRREPGKAGAGRRILRKTV